MTAIRESELIPDVFFAVLAIADNKHDEAEGLLRRHLKEHGDDAAALKLLAEIGARLGQFDGAEALLKRALQIAPEYPAALSLLERISAEKVTRSGLQELEFPRGLRSEGLNAADQYGEALDLFARVVERFPESSRNWLSYGHILRTAGRRDDSVAAYRRAISLKPDAGEAWWALADLKTRELGSDDIEALTQLLQGGAEAEEISRLHFALGRALEQAGRYKESFEHYEQGNAIVAASHGHDRDALTSHVLDSQRLFDVDYFQARKGCGFAADDPIFVLGMPRAGSTLIEQILASHRDIEGTTELAELTGIANWLAGGKQAALEPSDYLPTLAGLPADELLKLGKAYIWGTALRRQTSKPYFVDKMPNNWLHLGLILTILPNAKIIDARRHPMACGLSNFRQHYGTGHAFSYNLVDIGSFYSNYVRLMDHFDRIAPGRIIRVIHEELVADPEAQIHLLLDRLGLPFDEACLRFHDNKRAVRTSSSEQVRRPISNEGLDQWREFEPWLGPLRDALGPIADAYPAVPKQL